MNENPLLNEEERALCETAPEECLRRFIARGGLALDRVTAGLPPQVAAAVRVIVSGERLTPGGEVVRLAEGERDDATTRALKAPLPAAEPPAPGPGWTRALAAECPELVRRFEAQPTVPEQALKAPLPATAGGPAVPEQAFKAPLPAAAGGPAVPEQALKAPLPAAAGGPAVPEQALKAPLPAAGEPAQPPEWARAFAAAYPRVADLLAAGRLTPREAVETIRTIDNFLGNYLTGTRYAAP